MDTKKYHQNLFQITIWPFILYGLLALGYAYKSKFSWFSYHPLAMVVAFVSLAGNATVIKKIGGYDNTKKHGILMGVACALAGFGWYVIHTNKDLMKKQHLLTIHGKLGAAMVVGYFLIGIVGGVALHPDFGIMKTNQTIRFAHKWAGRLFTAGAWTSCFLGFATLYQDLLSQFYFGAPLFALGIFVLL